MNKKIIRNARIITMNERLDILPNGNILIENGKIKCHHDSIFRRYRCGNHRRRRDVLITWADQYTYSSSYDYAKGLCR